ncbi:ZIP zinc transporter-domain-containing protein [Pseudomassariella vexata]|uniref:ZIP zinc transporter-domain-containing protein n=1 Tax=Pseudomassariella vexata TaxID=1141098 RepID=A0A1Y2DBF9_9PEZI|nr:ZIP zinc transporter-domain-containing protein [Pseudomassariella vexata]ORY56598.1 ZIP zinc transporter-domain-containing protein [Pseudomassariella vexata]
MLGIHSQRPSAFSRGGWMTWIFSVVVTSVLINQSLGWLSSISHPAIHPPSEPLYHAGPASSSNDHFERLSRRAECQHGGTEGSNDNLSLRVGAVFIILGVSSLACLFPILAVKFPGLKMPAGFFFAVRHFGTGVLIATAFVHLLPTAFTLLGNPCLPQFWTNDYPAMPGAIALSGIFIVTVVEMVLHPARKLTPEVQAASTRAPAAMQVLRGRSMSIGRGLSHIDSVARRNDNGNGDGIEPTLREEESSTPEPKLYLETGLDGTAAEPQALLTPEQKRRKEVMNCVLLEIGILFHSVFIGMALSVSIEGSEFVVLLIAISFHQTFEGLALGARISAIEWKQSSFQPVLMAVAYGCTTPIGQAIGLAARSAYSPDSDVGLLLVGIMNAISAGLLVFASLVELLSEDLLTDESWRILRGKRRVAACLLILAGAFGMSLVGAWA